MVIAVAISNMHKTGVKATASRAVPTNIMALDQ